MTYRYHKDGTLPADESSIFAFGSNLAGVHGAGAARAAADLFGAEFGVGFGRTGRSFAIPTKDRSINTMPLEDIAPHVTLFIDYAKEHPHESFFVTRIGCGLAGYRDEQIAPMFRGAPENCDFPNEWAAYIEDAT